ncbi:MAG TPA: alpha/beta hydrolase [Baekduia sp.]
MINVVDADLERLLAELEAKLALVTAEPTLDGERAEFGRLVAWMQSGPEAIATELALVADDHVPGRSGRAIPIRVYDAEAARAEPADVIVYLHGGGWMIGDVDTHDEICRLVADRTRARVVAVDYRLAPEHPFPAALHDCLDVLEALTRDPETGRLCVAGDSAGGNLAAALALHCRDTAGPEIAAQLLFYPCLDIGREDGSMARFAEGYVLTKDAMFRYYDQYAPGREQRSDPLAAPLRAASLEGLPPTVISTAGFDPLLDEGRDFAGRLVAADVPTTYLPFPTLTHGWIDMASRVPAAFAARTHVLEAFAAVLGSPQTRPADLEAQA